MMGEAQRLSEPGWPWAEGRILLGFQGWGKERRKGEWPWQAELSLDTSGWFRDDLSFCLLQGFPSKACRWSLAIQSHLEFRS